MKITIIGTGYVGLVVGACLADMGNEVICVDNNENKLNQLKKGNVTIYEPGLEELVKNNLSENRLSFTSDIASAVKKSQVCFIAVGTPQHKDGAADLESVYEVAKSIGKSMNDYKLIIDKSTVPVGTSDKIKELIKEYSKFEFDIVSNPEFLKQGNAVNDFLHPDRVIIGSDSPKATQIMKEIYEPFFRSGNKVLIMDIKSAEMTKYAANAFLATKISFINEIANLCEKVGADIEMVRAGMSADTRIGNKFLFPGIGYGGSCFPKDIRALIKTGAEHGCPMEIIKAVEKTNKNQQKLFVEKILSEFGSNLEGKVFGVWGCAFKPKTNDMREAPSIPIINKLLKHGAEIKIFDPKALDTAHTHFGNKVLYSSSAYEAIQDVDALLLLTEWNEFKRPDFNKIKSLMKSPTIFDGRNQYDISAIEKFGFKYFPIGK